MLYVVYVMECWHCRTRLDLLCRVCLTFGPMAYVGANLSFRLISKQSTTTWLNFEKPCRWSGGEPSVTITLGALGKSLGVRRRSREERCDVVAFGSCRQLTAECNLFLLSSFVVPQDALRVLQCTSFDAPSSFLRV